MSCIFIDYHLMQHPKKTILSSSRKQSKTYLQLHRQKSTNGTNSSSTLHTKTSHPEFSHQANLFETEMENIKLEEGEWMGSEFLEAELKWTSEIDAVRQQISELKQSVKGEHKAIKDIEKDLSSKRTKLVALQEKAEKSSLLLSNTPLQDYDQLIASYLADLDQINSIGQKSILEANQQCEQLLNQEAELSSSIEELEKEIFRLEKFQSKEYAALLQQLLEEEEMAKVQVEETEKERADIEKYIQEMEAGRPTLPEIHRRYVQLYEKMFLNEQLDTMEQIIEYKNEEITYFQNYAKRKMTYRSKRKEIEEIQGRVMQKKRTITQLEQEIRKYSTKLLELYQES